MKKNRIAKKLIFNILIFIFFNIYSFSLAQAFSCNRMAGGKDYKSAFGVGKQVDICLAHHQAKNQYDYFFLDLTATSTLLTELKTASEGIKFKDDESFTINAYPYAGFEIQNEKQERIALKRILGTANRSEKYTLSDLGPGKYYILFGTENDMHKDTILSLKVEEQRYDAGTNMDAPNNPEQAMKIEVGQEYKGFISPNDIYDYYYFEAEESGLYTIFAQALDSSGSFSLALYQDNILVKEEKAVDKKALVLSEVEAKKNSRTILGIKYEYGMSQSGAYLFNIKKSEIKEIKKPNREVEPLEKEDLETKEEKPMDQDRLVRMWIFTVLGLVATVIFLTVVNLLFKNKK